MSPFSDSIRWHYCSPSLFSQVSALLLQKKKTDCSRPEGIELGLKKTAEGTFRSLIFIRGCSVYMEAVTSLFKSFQPAFRWETESSSNVYAQESRWGTFEMDFISGQKKCSFNQCVSACVCVCTVKEGTSQRDRFRQSYCILFALFRISQLYLTCFFFSFYRRKCTSAGLTCCHPLSSEAQCNI